MPKPNSLDGGEETSEKNLILGSARPHDLKPEHDKKAHQILLSFL